MKAVSLFSGAGGFEQGFERAGIETILQAEQDPWCLEILQRHWPNTPKVNDVRELTLHSLRDSVGLKGKNGIVVDDASVHEAVAVGAQHNTVVETVGATAALSNDVVGVAESGIPSAVHAAIAEISPKRQTPPVLVGVGLPLIDDVTSASVPSPESAPHNSLGATSTNGGVPLYPSSRDVGSATAFALVHTKDNITFSADVDLVYGGWPCQGNSVAGNRGGMDDARSGLWSEVKRILRELRPRWFVGENVPGLLSVNQGIDFAQVLLDLEELGFGWAYGVLDARFFGVAQRRRRVFIVGGPTARAAAEVLAVCESCGGHPAKGRETEQDLAATLRSRSAGAGVNMPGRGGEDDADTLRSHPRAGSNSLGGIVAGGKTARYGKGTDSDATDVLVFDERQITSPGNRSTVEPGAACPTLHQAGSIHIANTVQASAGHHGHSSPRGDGSDNQVVASPLTAVCGRTNDSAGSHGTGPVNLIDGPDMMVRRLTPRECERLMGWADDWTRWTADGREIPDSHRYRICGNGVVSTVAEWIGYRLVAVDRMLALEAAS